MFRVVSQEWRASVTDSNKGKYAGIFYNRLQHALDLSTSVVNNDLEIKMSAV